MPASGMDRARPVRGALASLAGHELSRAHPAPGGVQPMPDKNVHPIPVPANCPYGFELGNPVAPGRVICPHETDVASSASPGKANCPHSIHVGNPVAPARVNCPHAIQVGNPVAPGHVICPHATQVGSSVAPARVSCPHAIKLGDPSRSPAGRSVHWIPVSARTQEKLCRARELFGAGQPASELGPIFDRVLDALVAMLARRRARATPKPRAPRGRRGVSVRHIPPDVRRVVWSRDGGQCAFVGTGGMRCACTRGLEFDLVAPVELGGTWAVENVRLLCRVHKEYVAEGRAEHVPSGET